MNQIEIFKSNAFGEIRTVQVEEEPWFVGKDVLGILPLIEQPESA